MFDQMIFGLGSGRCGTCSLAAVLDAQFQASITHERYSRLPWKLLPFDMDIVLTAMWRGQTGRFIGDCAPWYLNYVGHILRTNPKTKFVCLKRDKKDCTDSIYSVNAQQGVNHFTSETSQYWDSSKWDIDAIDSLMYRRCFPHYDLPMREAVSLYYDTYYKIAAAQEKEFPENFRVFDVDSALNTEEGQIEMLKFCNIFGGFILPGIRLVKQNNTGGETDDS